MTTVKRISHRFASIIASLQTYQINFRLPAFFHTQWESGFQPGALLLQHKECLMRPLGLSSLGSCQYDLEVVCGAQSDVLFERRAGGESTIGAVSKIFKYNRKPSSIGA